MKRRELALENGATAVFDPTSQAVDLVAETLKATSQRGADVVFDCAGNQRTLDTAFVAVRPRGSIMNIAVWGTRPSLDIGALTAKEVSLSSTSIVFRAYDRAADRSRCLCKGVLGCDRVHAEMLDAVADGRFPVDGLESLVTRRIPLEDLVERGIKALLHETDKHGERSAYFWIC